MPKGNFFGCGITVIQIEKYGTEIAAMNFRHPRPLQTHHTATLSLSLIEVLRSHIPMMEAIKVYF